MPVVSHRDALIGDSEIKELLSQIPEECQNQFLKTRNANTEDFLSRGEVLDLIQHVVAEFETQQQVLHQGSAGVEDGKEFFHQCLPTIGRDAMGPFGVKSIKDRKTNAVRKTHIKTPERNSTPLNGLDS